MRRLQTFFLAQQIFLRMQQYENSILDTKIKQYLEDLAQETNSVRQSEKFKNYLDLLTRFWNYSYRNQLLILAQKETATRVAGYRAWCALGRQVNAGEKAIKILAPFKKKLTSSETTGNEEEETRVYFHSVSVFDISQTSGAPLLDASPVINSSFHESTFLRLIEFCELQKIKVSFEKLGLHNAYGYSAGGKIIIGEDQSIDMKTCTLIHEIAHELLHYSLPYSSLPTRAKEIQAESVCYVVTRAIGLNSKSSVYLAPLGFPSKDLTYFFEAISKTAKIILNFLYPQQYEKSICF